MSIATTTPQHLTRGYPGNIVISRRAQAANALVTLMKRGGTALFSNETGTVSTVNTTTNSAVSKDGYQINIGSAAGVTTPGEYWLTDDPEAVLVESRVGTVLALRRPLTKAHVSGATFQGTTISIAVNAEITSTLFWDGRASFNIDGGQALMLASVECTAYPSYRTASVQNLFDEQPKLAYLKGREMDLERLLDLGQEDVLKKLSLVAQDHRARTLTGSPELAQATTYAALVRFYRRKSSDESTQLMMAYAAALETEIAAIAVLVPRDADQDGVVEADERISPKSFRMDRA